MATPALTFTAPFLEKEIVKEVTVDDYTDPKIASILDAYGFVIIKNILSADEQKEAEALLYDDLLQCVDQTKLIGSQGKQLGRIFQQVSSGEEHFPKASLPGLASKGFLSLYGFPQSKFPWKMRMNPKVKTIYSNLHQVGPDDLCVSTDVSFFTPERKQHEDCNIWCHADQNIYLKVGSEKSYQGILYVWDSTTPDTSNTVLVPKSNNNEYYELLKAIPENLHDGHSLYISTIPDVVIREQFLKMWREKSRRIPVPAGGLLIFNSKSIHQGYQSGFRLAQALCWEPKANRSEKALRSKLEACNMGIATTHWASLGTHHGVSFIKPRDPVYNSYHHKCIFPMQPVKTEVLINQITNPMARETQSFIKKQTNESLAANIKPEYLRCL